MKRPPSPLSPPDTTAELLQCLRAARLVSAARARCLARRWAANLEDAGCESRVRELIAEEVLTRYQASQVLAGRARRLRLGPYRVLDRLGIGGMGQVYKAEHILMRRLVALKVVARLPRSDEGHDLPGGGAPSRRDLLARFRHEIRWAGRMSHPNVVTAYDAGIARGFLYLVMEYFEGTDLGRFVGEYGPLPVPLACEAVRQAALALQYAHDRGLVHRDVKPDNLLLVRGAAEPTTNVGSLPSLPDGSSGEGLAFVKLLDLGLALPVNRLPKRAERAGTPDFMAPELAHGHFAVDGRCDLYSLGCTFYYLLTGCVPFPGGTYAEKLLRHELDFPRALSDLRPEVPRSVAAVVERLMAKRPEDRYPGPAAVASLLWALAEHGWSVDTPPPERLLPVDEGADEKNPDHNVSSGFSSGPALAGREFGGEGHLAGGETPPLRDLQPIPAAPPGDGSEPPPSDVHADREISPGPELAGSGASGELEFAGLETTPLRDAQSLAVLLPRRQRLPGVRAVALAALAGALLAGAFVGLTPSVLQAPEQARADTSAPPFRIERVNRDFVTLTEAISSASDRDVIVVRGVGPYRFPSTDLGGRELVLRAAGRERPRLEPKNAEADGPWQSLFSVSSALTLEGFDLVTSGDAPLVAGRGATVRLTDCRLTTTGRGPAVLVRGGTLFLQSCRLRAAASAIALEADLPCLAELAGNDVAVSDPTGAALAVWAPETSAPVDVTLRLEGNAIRAGRVAAVRALPGRLRVCANANDFTFSEALIGFTGYPDTVAWRRSTTWQGRDNRCHTAGYWIRVDGRPVAVNDSIGWQRLWAEPSVAGRGQEVSVRPAALR
jgi:serine/threonine-protein kinase